MQLQKVIFHNIGVYKGTHEINLTVHPPEKNVILFGGENGSGKTTFLTSIRIALFGAFAFRFATENEKYYQHIFSLLNKAAVNEGANLFQIILEFSETEKYQRNNYRFVRRWKLFNKKPKEQFSIMKNGEYLKEDEKENYHSHLKETIPVELFNMCLFDGEELSRIVNDNRLSEYLESAGKVLFNLYLFETLESDLLQYVKYSKDESQLFQEEEELFLLDKQISDIETNIMELTEEEISINETINKLKELLSSLKRQFEINGGLVKEERDLLQAKVTEIETERKGNSDKLKEFVSTLLPFYLTKDLMFSIEQQMELESSWELRDKLESSLTEKKLNEIINTLKSELSSIPIAQDNAVIQLRKDLLGLFPVPDLKPIHRASFAQKSKVQSMVNIINRLEINDYIGIIESNQQLLEQAKDFRHKIKLNEQTHAFRDIFSEIEEITKEISVLNIKLIELTEKKEASHLKLEETKKIRKLMISRLQEEEKSKGSYIIANKIKELSTKFRIQQQKKKLQDVQIEATRMLNGLMRKKDYVSSLVIDSNTFEVTLYNQSKEEIIKERISSGEKEILLLSIVWAMFKCSRIRLPFIFDTLLGRLDKTHKQTVLSTFIPACGEQVIILSTDSEIDQVHYEIIKPHVANEYTLDFITSEERVEIHNKYFDFDQQEVVKQ
ncbi:DNA sulfur modification protein DndD [Bacillus carboniphilus]|uniref:DNA sulfur modification protein DndD n=1 Tax=Bacillus carboniphilus TaxID=86663 RepID=A0ABY9JYF5_9BACI|nr:DNA sulfur modification protein DndD [Bacillus carboniphilus]WLR42620.1 DNA sulfur modification protein DndD [Bacillus carboniphilus]